MQIWTMQIWSVGIYIWNVDQNTYSHQSEWFFQHEKLFEIVPYYIILEYIIMELLIVHQRRRNFYKTSELQTKDIKSMKKSDIWKNEFRYGKILK